jgi:hypothetical protein
MAYALRKYARAWLFGWDGVFGDPAAIRPKELTPQMLRKAWALRRQMRALGHHTAAQRIALRDAHSCPSLYRDVFRSAESSDHLDIAGELQRTRRFERHGVKLGLRLKSRAKTARERVIADKERRSVKILDLLARRADPSALARDADTRIPDRHVVLHDASDVGKNASLSKGGEARDRLRLELAKPKRLAGPADRDAVDVLFAQVYGESPWLQEPLEYLWQSAVEAIEKPEACFHLPPVLLVGPPGCGKTHAAMKLAELADCPSTRLDMSGATAVFDIAGIEFAWSSSHPAAVTKLIQRGGAANPIMILDEVEKRGVGSSGGDPAQALLPLLQAATARDFRDLHLQAPTDLSRVSWILLANDIARLPAPLIDRCAVFRVGYPGGQDLRNLVARKLGSEAEPEVIDVATKELETGRMTLRGLDRLATRIKRISRQPLLN